MRFSFEMPAGVRFGRGAVRENADLLALGRRAFVVAGRRSGRVCGALADVEAALTAMTEALLGTFGNLPLLYAGGVMSNGILRAHLTARFGGSFAPPAFSADNAAGIAVLCRLKEEGEL